MIAEAGRDRGDLRPQQRQRGGDDGREQQRPQAVQQDAAGALLRAAAVVLRASRSARSTGGVGSLRRPSQRAEQRRDDPPAGGDEDEQVVAERVRLDDGDERQQRRGRRAQQHGALEQVDEPQRRASADERLEQVADAVDAVDEQVGRVEQLGRASPPTARRRRSRARSRPSSTMPRRPSKASTSVRSSPTYIATSTGVIASSRAHARRPCRSGRAGAARARARPSWITRPGLARAVGDLAGERLGAHLVVGAAPVQRDDRALVLAQQPRLAQAIGAHARRRRRARGPPSARPRDPPSRSPAPRSRSSAPWLPA